jgi:hypothetical protein
MKLLDPGTALNYTISLFIYYLQNFYVLFIQYAPFKI